MNRKQFMSAGGVLAATSILPLNSLHAQHCQNNGFDQLTDAEGNFLHLSLPYNKNFLEPYMDEETVYLCKLPFFSGQLKV